MLGPVVKSCIGFAPRGSVSRSTARAVSGESRLTVSLATPDKRQICEKLQSLSKNSPSSPAANESSPPTTTGCRRARKCERSCDSRCSLRQCWIRDSTDEKHSSGLRRNNSSCAWVNVLMGASDREKERFSGAICSNIEQTPRSCPRMPTRAIVVTSQQIRALVKRIWVAFSTERWHTARLDHLCFAASEE